MVLFYLFIQYYAVLELFECRRGDLYMTANRNFVPSLTRNDTNNLLFMIIDNRYIFVFGFIHNPCICNFMSIDLFIYWIHA